MINRNTLGVIPSGPERHIGTTCLSPRTPGYIKRLFCVVHVRRNCFILVRSVPKDADYVRTKVQARICPRSAIRTEPATTCTNTCANFRSYNTLRSRKRLGGATSTMSIFPEEFCNHNARAQPNLVRTKEKITPVYVGYYGFDLSYAVKNLSGSWLNLGPLFAFAGTSTART